MSLRILAASQLRPRPRPSWKSTYIAAYTPATNCPWMCQSCRISSTRRWSTPESVPAPRSKLLAVEKEKPYYITTPIFYVNAGRHFFYNHPHAISDANSGDSSPCGPSLYYGPHGHPQTMAGPTREKGNTVYGDR